MGLKKRARVTAQFNMSSLTDIIFLLLIFFMLTSTLVAPNSLNLKLPSSSRSSVPSSQTYDDVRITADGSYFFKSRRIAQEQLDAELEIRSQRSAAQYTITISPDRGAPVEAVVFVMDAALRYDINGVLAADE